jgi:hypothetical protein
MFFNIGLQHFVHLIWSSRHRYINFSDHHARRNRTINRINEMQAIEEIDIGDKLYPWPTRPGVTKITPPST